MRSFLLKTQHKRIDNTQQKRLPQREARKETDRSRVCGRERRLVVDQVVGLDGVVGQFDQLIHRRFGGQHALEHLLGHILHILADFGEHAQQGTHVFGRGVMQLVQRGLELGILFDVGLERVGSCA